MRRHRHSQDSPLAAQLHAEGYPHRNRQRPRFPRRFIGLCPGHPLWRLYAQRPGSPVPHEMRCRPAGADYQLRHRHPEEEARKASDARIGRNSSEGLRRIVVRQSAAGGGCGPHGAKRRRFPLPSRSDTLRGDKGERDCVWPPERHFNRTIQKQPTRQTAAGKEAGSQGA